MVSFSMCHVKLELLPWFWPLPTAHCQDQCKLPTALLALRGISMHIQGSELQAPGLLKAWQALLVLGEALQWLLLRGLICLPSAGGGIAGGLIRAKWLRRPDSIPQLGRLQQADLAQL